MHKDTYKVRMFYRTYLLKWNLGLVIFYRKALLNKYFILLLYYQNDSVAQLVEQMTLNHWVESSSLSGVT